MKISLSRWVFAALLLVIAMTVVAFTITLFNYLILYFIAGIFYGSFSQMSYLSIKIGLFTGVLITIGLWIKHRFNIR